MCLFYRKGRAEFRLRILPPLFDLFGLFVINSVTIPGESVEE